MKKILIMTALLASGVILSGCGNNAEQIENSEIENTNIESNSGISEQDLLEMPETIENESGNIVTVTGTNTVSSQIKGLIEKRKEEMKTETGNNEELNENDIAFLEAVLEKMSKKK